MIGKGFQGFRFRQLNQLTIFLHLTISSGHFQPVRNPDVIRHAADRQVSVAEAFRAAARQCVGSLKPRSHMAYFQAVESRG
jgi:hypothetical protein